MPFIHIFITPLSRFLSVTNFIAVGSSILSCACRDRVFGNNNDDSACTVRTQGRFKVAMDWTKPLSRVMWRAHSLHALRATRPIISKTKPNLTFQLATYWLLIAHFKLLFVFLYIYLFLTVHYLSCPLYSFVLDCIMCCSLWHSWQKGGTLYYFRLRTKQSNFPHNMNKFLKRKFRASLSLISIKNWQELFLTIKRECSYICMYVWMYVYRKQLTPCEQRTLFTSFISHFYSCSMKKEQKNSYLGPGYLEQGKLQRCVRSSDEKSLWINAKIYHTSDLSQFVKTLARAGQAWPAAS